MRAERRQKGGDDTEGPLAPLPYGTKQVPTPNTMLARPLPRERGQVPGLRILLFPAITELVTESARYQCGGHR